MTQEHDLLRAIAREPDDDGLRLVFADWLEKQGQADRAAFIRAQVRLNEIRRSIPPPDEDALWPFFPLQPCPGSWHCPGDTPERRDLAFCCRHLLDSHEQEWLVPLGGSLRHEWVWSRGFVEVVDPDPAALASVADELFDTHPIRRLILTGLKGDLESLARIPADNRLTALDLILNDLDLNALHELARLRNLSHMKELNLSFNGLRDSAIEFLRDDPFFQGFTLDLSGNPFTHEGRERLRGHFGSRVSFDRQRHPDRLFAFSSDAGWTQIHPEQIGSINVRAGWGKEAVQVMIEETVHAITLIHFDHAGGLLHVEARSCSSLPEERRVECDAWLDSLGYRPSTIRVKRFPGVYDFPKGWSDQFDSPDDEPEDYAAARVYLERWLAENAFRHGSFCGGHYFSRDSGKPIDL